MNSEMYFETDWLASNPVFYNENTGKISHKINDVIDFSNLELDPEGLCNYLDFGYSVFGQTPIKGVKFLEHSSKIFKVNSKIVIEKKRDLAEDFLSNYSYSDPEEVLFLIKEDINKNINKFSGDIVVPTSGGYDSRLIDALIEEKSRIRAFTYGTSEDQSKSSEVLYAKYICEKMNISWKRVDLGYYNENLDWWIREFGVSACANGTYHTEFLSAISDEIIDKNNSIYITGIIGDAWAGSIKKIDDMIDVNNITRLGYTHGMSVDSKHCRIKSLNDQNLVNSFLRENKDKLRDECWQIVLTMRLKMILLSFLVRLPQLYGFSNVYAPYLNKDIALKMLTIDPKQRNNRIWQRRFFEQMGLTPENAQINVQHINTLNYQALKKVRLEPLDKGILSEYIDSKYIDWVNDNFYKDFSKSLYEKLLHTLPGHALLKVLGIDDEGHSMRPYSAYLVLKPLQKLLELRQ